MAHKKLSTIFFGTYTFAEKILQFLINSEMFDVQRIITREDQPLGRKKILTAPPTKIIGQKMVF